MSLCHSEILVLNFIKNEFSKCFVIQQTCLTLHFLYWSYFSQTVSPHACLQSLNLHFTKCTKCAFVKCINTTLPFPHPLSQGFDFVLNKNQQNNLRDYKILKLTRQNMIHKFKNIMFIRLQSNCDMRIQQWPVSGKPQEMLCCLLSKLKYYNHLGKELIFITVIT